MTKTEFPFLFKLAGTSMQARIEGSEEDIFLTEGVFSVENDVLNLGILRIREADVSSCEFETVFLEKGYPMLDAASGLPIAKINLSAGAVLSLYRQ